MKHRRHDTATPARASILWFAAALALCCIAGAANADSRLTYKGTNGKYIVSIRPGTVRIDTDGSRWQLYVERSNTLFTVLPKQHSYTRLNATTAAALRHRMAALRDKIEQQLAQLPPDQRQAARAALAEQLPGFARSPQPTSIQNTGNTAFVDNIECRVVHMMRGDHVEGQACIARAAALGLSNAEHETLANMFQLMQTALDGTGYETTRLPYTQLQGLPIRLSATRTAVDRSLVDISHAPLADDLFIIPVAFNERKPDQ